MQLAEAPPAPGDGRGLELDWCGPGGWAKTRLDQRRSLVAIGIVGSGKTSLARALASQLLAGGGRVVAIDRGTGEYAEAAGVVRRSRLVDALAGITLDPLRLFTGPDALAHAIAVFRLLAGITDAGSQARTSAALAAGVARAVGEGAPSLVEVAAALEASADPDTRRVGVAVGALLASGLLPFMGDGELPVLDGDYDCLWLPPAWPDQPLRDEVLTYLAVALGRSATAADPRRPAALVLDNLPIKGPTGDVVAGALWEGAAANAAVWVLSLLLDDVPAAVVDGFVASRANRLVLRSSPDEALALARFVGLDAWLAKELALAGGDDRCSEAELCAAMRSLEARGRAVWRDGSGRVGLVQLPRCEPATNTLGGLR